MHELVLILGDDSRGIYMPLLARNLLNAGWSNIDADDVSYIEEHIDSDEDGVIWDIWEDILQSAKYIDANGDVWRLYQDGALFAYNSTELEKHELAAVEVCSDCAQFLINNDLPPDTDDFRDSGILEGAERLGECALVPDDLKTFNADLEDDEFSSSPCDCCGTPLAGERLTVIHLETYLNQ